MNIELVRLTPQYREQLIEMLTEWKADIETTAQILPPMQYSAMIFTILIIIFKTLKQGRECGRIRSGHNAVLP